MKSKSIYEPVNLTIIILGLAWLVLTIYVAVDIFLLPKSGNDFWLIVLVTLFNGFVLLLFLGALLDCDNIKRELKQKSVVPIVYLSLVVCLIVGEISYKFYFIRPILNFTNTEDRITAPILESINERTLADTRDLLCPSDKKYHGGVAVFLNNKNHNYLKEYHKLGVLAEDHDKFDINNLKFVGLIVYDKGILQRNVPVIKTVYRLFGKTQYRTTIDTMQITFKVYIFDVKTKECFYSGRFSDAESVKRWLMSAFNLSDEAIKTIHINP